MSILHNHVLITAAATTLILSCPSVLGSDSALPGDVDTLESQITGACDPSAPLAARVSKLERVVYGHEKTGPLLKRIGDLRNANYSVAEGHKSTAENDIRLGIKLHAQGQLDEAEQAFQRAILTDPKNVNAHFNLGVLCEERGHLTLALLHYQAAAANAPEDVEILSTIDSVRRKLTSSAGLFHADRISAPLLQGQNQKISTAIDLQFAAAVQASGKDVAKPAERIHPLRRKVLYTAAVFGMAATANLPGGNVGNAIFGTVRRSFSCPLCHWISRF